MTTALDRRSPLAIGAAAAILLAACSLLAQPAAPAGDYQPVAAALERLIDHEMEEKGLAAFSVALVDADRVVWSRAFGSADPDRHIPASPATTYRIGSVSKLFTDIGIMRLVERGEIDLDAPVIRYLPDFHPANPFGQPITIRQLTSHRSGLVREPPVGHYFDATGPSLADTVASLNTTELVYAPSTHTKYSNAGIAVAGYVLERTQHTPFATYLQHTVLEPLGMTNSAFEPRADIVASLSRSYMWTYHKPPFAAPTFEFGMAPAGSMYSTVGDLARFVMTLFPDGKSVVRRETLERMWVPQFAPPGTKTGYGIGFRVGDLEGHRLVGHGGAIYGFATEVEALPDERLGAIAVTTKDAANAVTTRIATEALRLMLGARAQRPTPAVEATAPVPAAVARRIAGRYTSDSAPFELSEFDGRVYLTRLAGGVRAEIRQRGADLVTDDPLEFGTKVSLPGPPEPIAKPAPMSGDWQGLVGEYGWDYDTLYVFERDGRLTVLIEWFFLNPLEQLSATEFRFPTRNSLYESEKVTFALGPDGRATALRVSGVVFPRRADPAAPGATFRIVPVKPVAELRRDALAALPPQETGEFRQADLVDVTQQDPRVRLDIRYAGSNNFMNAPLYTESRAFLQRPAAEALARVQRAVAAKGFGLLVHDAYRPWYVTKMFWDGTPPDKHIFVADPAQGSRHNRGCAVDLTLYDLKTAKAVEMTGGYDEMSERSFAIYPGGTSLQRWHRDLLRHAMETEGFTVYPYEWWHFDYRDWKQYPILNVPFEKLLQRRGGASPPRPRSRSASCAYAVCCASCLKNSCARRSSSSRVRSSVRVAIDHR